MEFSEYEVVEEEVESEILAEIEPEIDDQEEDFVRLEEDEEATVDEYNEPVEHSADVVDEDDDDEDEVAEEIEEPDLEQEEEEEVEEDDDDDDEDYDNYPEIMDLESGAVSPDGSTGGAKPSRKKRKPSEEDDDWLKALEEGRLHEVDEELKKMNDPKLMTARQRALLDSKTAKKNKEELDAAHKTKSDEILDEATLEKNLLKARKRRQQAEEKKEKDRKMTIERLLNKKDPGSKPGGKGRKKKPEIPKVTYINNDKGIYICFPANTIPEFEVFSEFAAKPRCIRSPEETVCARAGCSNPRKYKCSKSGLPCCSLACYKLIESN